MLPAGDPSFIFSSFSASSLRAVALLSAPRLCIRDSGPGSAHLRKTETEHCGAELRESSVSASGLLSSCRGRTAALKGVAMDCTHTSQRISSSSISYLISAACASVRPAWQHGRRGDCKMRQRVAGLFGHGFISLHKASSTGVCSNILVFRCLAALLVIVSVSLMSSMGS